MKYYLAYGSNLNLSQMKYRCPYASLIGTTVLKDYRLVFKGGMDNFAYLTIEESVGDYVPLSIFKITKKDEKNLDIYEGYPKLYEKRYISVTINKFKHKALIYVMKNNFDYHLPSSDYIDICLQGYNDFEFDKELLNRAYDYTKTNKILKR